MAPSEAMKVALRSGGASQTLTIVRGLPNCPVDLTLLALDCQGVACDELDQIGVTVDLNNSKDSIEMQVNPVSTLDSGDYSLHMQVQDQIRGTESPATVVQF